MPNSKRIILMIQFSVLFSIGGFCAGLTEDTTITPTGWNVPRQIDREHAVIYSLKGDYGFTRYWEIKSCGPLLPNTK